MDVGREQGEAGREEEDNHEDQEDKENLIAQVDGVDDESQCTRSSDEDQGMEEASSRSFITSLKREDKCSDCDEDQKKENPTEQVEGEIDALSENSCSRRSDEDLEQADAGDDLILQLDGGGDSDSSEEFRDDERDEDFVPQQAARARRPDRNDRQVGSNKLLTV